MEKSKTQLALELVAKGETPYSAAKTVGIATSTLYTAMKRQKGATRCPCCGQALRPGFAVDRSVLKDPE